MVESCAAVGCTSRRIKGTSLKFHRIPKDQELRQQWLDAIKRINYEPSETTVICGNHFTPDDYEINVHGNKVLKKGAVPSQFEFPANFNGEVKPRGIVKKQVVSILPKPETVNQAGLTTTPNQFVICPHALKEQPKPQNPINSSIIPQKSHHILRLKRGAYFGDFKESDLNHPEIRRRFWKIAHETLRNHKRQIQNFQLKVRRQQEKIDVLKCVIDELVKSND